MQRSQARGLSGHKPALYRDDTSATGARGQTTAFSEYFSPEFGGINLRHAMTWAGHSVTLLSGCLTSYIGCGSAVFNQLVSPKVRQKLRGTLRPLNIYRIETCRPAIAQQLSTMPVRAVRSDPLRQSIVILQPGYWHECSGWFPARFDVELPRLSSRSVMIGIRNVTNVSIALTAADRSQTLPTRDIQPTTSVVVCGSPKSGWEVVARGGLAKDVTVDINPLVRSYPGIITEQGSVVDHYSEDALYLSSAVLRELCIREFGEDRVFSADERLKNYIQARLKASKNCAFLLESKHQYHYIAVFIRQEPDRKRLLVYTHETLGHDGQESIDTEKQLFPLLKAVAGAQTIMWGVPKDTLQRDFTNCGVIAFENLVIGCRWPEAIESYLQLCTTLPPGSRQAVAVGKLPVALLWSCQRINLLTNAQLEAMLPWSEPLGSFLHKNSTTQAGKVAYIAADIRRYRLLHELSVNAVLPKPERLIVSLPRPQCEELVVSLPRAKIARINPYNMMFYNDLYQTRLRYKMASYTAKLRYHKVPLPRYYPFRVRTWGARVFDYLLWKNNPEEMDPKKRVGVYLRAASVLKPDSHDYLALIAKNIQSLLNKNESNPDCLIDPGDSKTRSRMSDIAWNNKQSVIALPGAIKERGHDQWTLNAVVEILRSTDLLKPTEGLVGRYEWGLRGKIRDYTPGSELYSRGLRQLLEQCNKDRLRYVSYLIKGIQFPRIAGIDFGSDGVNAGKLLVLVLCYLDTGCLEQDDVSLRCLRVALKLFPKPEALTGDGLMVYKRLLAVIRDRCKASGFINRAFRKDALSQAQNMLKRSQDLPDLQWKSQPTVSHRQTRQ